MYKVFKIKDNKIIEIDSPEVGERYFDILGRTVEYNVEKEFIIELRSPLNPGITLEDLDTPNSVELFIKLFEKTPTKN